MKLIEKQFKFTNLLAQLIYYAYSQGYTITMGEVLRTPEQAHANALSGAGIEHSLHLLKIAADLNLFKNGVWLKNTEAYKPLGEYWEGLSGTDYKCCWGGRFADPDGDHFSIEHEGVK